MFRPFYKLKEINRQSMTFIDPEFEVFCRLQKIGVRIFNGVIFSNYFFKTYKSGRGVDLENLSLALKEIKSKNIFFDFIFRNENSKLKENLKFFFNRDIETIVWHLKKFFDNNLSQDTCSFGIFEFPYPEVSGYCYKNTNAEETQIELLANYGIFPNIGNGMDRYLFREIDLEEVKKQINRQKKMEILNKDKIKVINVAPKWQTREKLSLKQRIFFAQEVKKISKVVLQDFICSFAKVGSKIYFYNFDFVDLFDLSLFDSEFSEPLNFTYLKDQTGKNDFDYYIGTESSRKNENKKASFRERLLKWKR